MTGKVFKIKSNDANNNDLKKLVRDLDIAEALNQTQTKQEEKWDATRWYAELRKRWYFHGSSWYMRRAQLKLELTEEEMRIGCNGVTGCIPECPFYPVEGRLEEADLQLNIKSLEEYLEKEKKACPICSKKGEKHQQHERDEQQQ